MPDKTIYQPDNIFAKILRGEIPCHRILENEFALVFMDVMPQADGHTLVIPKLNVINLLEMPGEAWGTYMQTVQHAAKAVKEGMQADGLLVQQFNGAAAGQTVFHLHFHLIPRWEGVTLRRHSGDMEKPAVLEANAARIKSAL